MINIEAICFLLVAVGSLALFYYLGFLAGREQAVNEILIFGDEEEEEKE